MTPNDSRHLLSILRLQFIPEDSVNWIKQLSKSNAETVGEKLVYQHRSTFLKGVAEGWSRDEFERRLRDKLGEETRKGGHEAQVITAMHTIFNRGRMDTFRQAEVQYFMFIAIMDARTTPICAQLDGRIFNPDDAQFYQPPLHYRCRSMLTPYWKRVEPGDERFLTKADRDFIRDEAGEGFLGKSKSSLARIDPETGEAIMRQDMRKANLADERTEKVKTNYERAMSRVIEAVGRLSPNAAAAIRQPLLFLESGQPTTTFGTVQGRLANTLKTIPRGDPSRTAIADIFGNFLGDLYASDSLTTAEFE